MTSVDRCEKWEKNMSSNLSENIVLTPEEYLEGEALAEEKHEYVHGEVYAMAGAEDAHVIVSLNVALAMKTHLRGSGCRLYASDMRVCINENDAYFYPDVMVTCDADDRKRKTMKQSPVLVVEVLSASTEAYDRGEKFSLYRQLESLQEYVLIDPHKYQLEVFRLNKQNRWELFSFSGEDITVEFASIGLQCPLVDIYEDVDFSSD